MKFDPKNLNDALDSFEPQPICNDRPETNTIVDPEPRPERPTPQNTATVPAANPYQESPDIRPQPMPQEEPPAEYERYASQTGPVDPDAAVSYGQSYLNSARPEYPEYNANSGYGRRPLDYGQPRPDNPYAQTDYPDRAYDRPAQRYPRRRKPWYASSSFYAGMLIPVLIMGAGAGGWAIYHSLHHTSVSDQTASDTPASVQPGEIRYELGDTVMLDAPTLISRSGIKMSNSESLVIDSELKSDNRYSFNPDTGEVKSRGLQYLSAGTYRVDLRDENSSGSITIVVEDKTAPEFIGMNDSITIEEGSSFKPGSYFMASDRDDVIMSSDTAGVNTSVPGQYAMTLSAKDKSGNEATKNIQIRVVSDNEIAQGTPISETIDGHVLLSSKGVSMAREGDMLITTIPPEQAVKDALTQSRLANAPLKYSQHTDTKNGYTASSFTTCPYGSMSELGMDYKSFREFANSGKPLDQYQTDQKIQQALDKINLDSETSDKADKNTGKDNQSKPNQSGISEVDDDFDFLDRLDKFD